MKWCIYYISALRKLNLRKLLRIVGKFHIFVFCLTSSVDGLIVHDLIEGILKTAYNVYCKCYLVTKVQCVLTFRIR